MNDRVTMKIGHVVVEQCSAFVTDNIPYHVKVSRIFQLTTLPDPRQFHNFTRPNRIFYFVTISDKRLKNKPDQIKLKRAVESCSKYFLHFG